MVTELGPHLPGWSQDFRSARKIQSIVAPNIASLAPFYFMTETVRTASGLPLTEMIYGRVMNELVIFTAAFSEERDGKYANAVNELNNARRDEFDRELLESFPGDSAMAIAHRFGIQAVTNAAILLAKASLFPDFQTPQDFRFGEMVQEQLDMIRTDLGDGHADPKWTGMLEKFINERSPQTVSHVLKAV